MEETVTSAARPVRVVETLAAVPVGLARRAFDRAAGDLEVRAASGGAWRLAGEATVLVLGPAERDVRCEHPAAQVLRRARGYVAPRRDEGRRIPVVLEVALASSLAVTVRLRALEGALPEGAADLARRLAREIEGWARAGEEAA